MSDGQFGRRRGGAVLTALLAALALWAGCSARTAGAEGVREPRSWHASEEPRRADVLEVAAPLVAAGEERLCAADPRVTACASHEPEGTPQLLGLAARAGALAVAWVYAGNPWLSPRGAVRASRVGVALFDAELRRSREVELPLADAATDVDLVAVPGGWVVAAQTAGGTELRWLREGGEPTDRRVSLAGATYPGIVATPTGELLVVHLGARDGNWPVLATLVALDGVMRWSVPVFASSIEPNFGAQVATDDGGFLIGRRTGEGVAVARVDRNGVVSVQAPISNSTEYPSLAWCGREGRLVWTDFSETGKIRAAAVDRSGRRSETEHVLGVIPNYFNHSPTLCEGRDWWVLLGGYTGSTGVSNRLDLTRVDTGRGAEAGAIPVLGSERVRAYDPRLVRLDDARVAVAWIALVGESQARIGLATVAAPRADRAAAELAGGA